MERWVQREGGGEREEGERNGVRFRSKRDEGVKERVHALGWLTEMVSPSGTLSLSVTVIVFALQLGYGEAWFRVWGSGSRV